MDRGANQESPNMNTAMKRTCLRIAHQAAMMTYKNQSDEGIECLLQVPGNQRKKEEGGGGGRGGERASTD